MERFEIQRRRYLLEIRSLIDKGVKEIAIIGKPGSGKTTFLNQLTTNLNELKYLTVRIPLREIYDERDLFSRIVRSIIDDFENHKLGQIKSKDLYKDFQEFLRSDITKSPLSISRAIDSIATNLELSGPIFILLDGLDESLTPSLLADSLKHLMEIDKNQLCLIITSRNLAHLELIANLRNFFIVNIDFALDELRELLYKYLPDISDEQAEYILHYADGSPLYITLIAEMVADGQLTDISSLESIPQNIDRWFRENLNQFIEKSADKEILVKVLLLISLFDQISLTDISEMTKIPEIRIQQSIRVSPFIYIDNNSKVSFFHVSIRDYFIRFYIFPEPLSISDFEFGAEEAERDVLLNNYFQKIPSIDGILNDKKTVIIGDRGSGKSSIVKHIYNIGINTKKVSKTLESQIILASNEHIDFLNKHSILDSSSHTPDHFKAIWLLYVSSILATQLYESDDIEYGRDCKRLLHAIGLGYKTNDKYKHIKNSWEWLKSRIIGNMQFKIGPITIKPDMSASGHSIDISEFLTKTIKILKKNNNQILILLDQIDQIAKYEREIQEQIIQGLFLAESDITHLGDKLRLVILIRTDLYEIYDIQEKNKLISRTEQLQWTHRDLLRMLLLRLYSNSSLDTVRKILGDDFDTDNFRINLALRIAFPEEIEGKHFQEWLFESMRNGNGHVSPRQIILFLILVKRYYTDSSTGFTTSLPLFDAPCVSRAMTKLSELSYEEIINDFRVAGSFVRNCAAGKLEDFSINEVRDLFNPDEGDINKQRETLERLGFLQRVVITENEERYFRFHIPSLFTRCWHNAIE